MHYIEPENRQQFTIGYNLDEIISSHNVVRIIDAIVEEVYESNTSRFDVKGKNGIGRKAFKPTTLLKLYIYGYLNSISSSRKLETETHRNLEMMWLLGHLKPDHKTISDYRKDNRDSIRFVTIAFRKFLKAKGYIDGKIVGIDGSKIKANAKRDMLTLKKIEKRTHKLEEELENYLTKLSSNDAKDDLDEELDNHEGDRDKHLLNKVVSLQQRIEKLESEKKFLEENNRKNCAPSDHDAMLMKTRDGKMPAYNMETAVDSKNQMIAAADVVTDTSDINQLLPTLNRLNEQISIVPQEVPADKGFYNTSQLHNIESQNNTKCFVPPVEDERTRKDKEAGISFEYNSEKGEYTCSEGKKLKLIQKNRKESEDKIVDIYQCKECNNCKIKNKCTKSKVGRIITRNKNQLWLDQYKERMQGAKGKLMKQLRKELVEHPFGTIKYWMGKIPILLRGKTKVQTEIDIYTTCYNLKRLINIENNEILMQMIRNHDWKVA